MLDVSITQLPARRDWEIDKVFVRRAKAGARRLAKSLYLRFSP